MNQSFVPATAARIFICDICAMHRSTITPRTPHSSQENLSVQDPKMANITLEDLMGQLQRSSASVDSKLGCIQKTLSGVEKNIADLRADVYNLSVSHDEMANRISDLEATAQNAHSVSKEVMTENITIKNQIFEITNRLSVIESHNTAGKITLTGIPSSVTDSPDIIARKIFDALKIPELIGDVLDIRNLTKKSTKEQGSRPSTSAATPSASRAFIITLKSAMIKDFIISKKREKKDLTVREVFSLNSSGKIFLNEFLPPNIYKLLRQTKAMALQLQYQYVWPKSGGICVRKTDGSPVITIGSEIDLAKLT
ncbi:uncharacterized protein LOC124413873 [Diprion similis]|uniref:uncharacterized protein LOC124413873 n=1 Tax=Diprion similis TaxID=362088 RepID=UPI001EF894E9|nr:uncharacterized protein LOC124413873 [Diprion similis]